MRVDLTVADAVAAMRVVLLKRPRTLLLASAVDSGGRVGPADAHWLGRDFPPYEDLLRVSRLAGTSGVLFGSRAVGTVAKLSSEDIKLTRHLTVAATCGGLSPFIHVVVACDGVRTLGGDARGLCQPALRNIS